MRHIRLRKGKLQAATYIYVHEQSGRAFWLVGVSHVADPEFWKEISQTIEIAEGQGCKVHYEHVLNDVNPEKISKVEDHPYTKLAEALGMQVQFSGLKYPDHWIRTDVTESQLRAASSKVSHFLTKLKDLKVPESLPYGRPIVKTALTIVAFLPTIGEVQAVIKDGRTDYAMRKMLPLSDDIITIWGAAHVPRMRKHLRRNGFTLQTCRYYTVMA